MATHSFTPVLGKRFRIVSLDECGRVTPESEFYVGDGFVSVTLSSEVEDGVEILKRKFTGALCVNELSSPSFKYFTLEVEFCGVNPDVLTIMTNAEPYEDASGDVAGFTVPEGTLDKRFALEIWTGLSGQACGAGQEQASGYMLLPFVQAGVMSSIEMTEEDAVTFSMESANSKGGNGWGTGPFNVVFGADDTPAPLPTALDPKDHLLIMDTGLAVPELTDTRAAVPSIGA